MSRYRRRSLGRSNGVRFLIWWNASQKRSLRSDHSVLRAITILAPPGAPPYCTEISEREASFGKPSPMLCLGICLPIVVDAEEHKVQSHGRCGGKAAVLKHVANDQEHATWAERLAHPLQRTSDVIRSQNLDQVAEHGRVEPSLRRPLQYVSHHDLHAARQFIPSGIVHSDKPCAAIAGTQIG
jgi:hypothetical protein